MNTNVRATTRRRGRGMICILLLGSGAILWFLGAWSAQAASAQITGDAGASGHYTAATLTALRSPQSSLESREGEKENELTDASQGIGSVLSNPLTWLSLWVLFGVGLTLFSYSLTKRKAMRPPTEMAWRGRAGPKDEYGRIL